MIPLQFALRRRMMRAGGGGAPISDLPLGALINVGTDGGAGTSNYEIADKDNLVSGVQTCALPISPTRNRCFFSPAPHHRSQDYPCPLSHS